MGYRGLFLKVFAYGGIKIEYFYLLSSLLFSINIGLFCSRITLTNLTENWLNLIIWPVIIFFGITQGAYVVWIGGMGFTILGIIGYYVAIISGGYVIQLSFNPMNRPSFWIGLILSAFFAYYIRHDIYAQYDKGISGNVYPTYDDYLLSFEHSIDKAKVKNFKKHVKEYENTFYAFKDFYNAYNLSEFFLKDISKEKVPFDHIKTDGMGTYHVRDHGTFFFLLYKSFGSFQAKVSFCMSRSPFVGEYLKSGYFKVDQKGDFEYRIKHKFDIDQDKLSGFIKELSSMGIVSKGDLSKETLNIKGNMLNITLHHFLDTLQGL